MTKGKISLNLRRIINFFVCTAMPGYEKVFFTPKYLQREPKQSKTKKETKTVFLTLNNVESSGNSPSQGLLLRVGQTSFF